MSIGKQNLDMHLREFSGSTFRSVTSSNVILYDVNNNIFIKS